MCGIVAYIGNQNAYPILIKGLQRLEYRGYDSAGVALLTNNELNIHKKKGKVNDLVQHCLNKNKEGNIGMGHTRWATHGEPNDVNAHPHLSNNNQLSIIHNGIIENYAVLKTELKQRGYTFNSDTDTEVLINFIEEIQKSQNLPTDEAVRIALQHVVGAYAIVIIDKNNPNQIIAARKSSPLVVGLGNNEYFVASDATPIIEYTKNVVYINDDEVIIIDLQNGLRIKSILDNTYKTPFVEELEWNLERLEKHGYEHFMLKEIFEQPISIRDSMRGRLNAQKGIIALGGFKDYEQKLFNAKRIIIVACGTSWHAGLVGEYLFEDLARIPVEVEYASEFRYRNPIIDEDDVVIAISQSGETADTLAAIQLAKERGATILGICNVVGSSISRATHAGAYTHAGPEIGVASTKAFTAQLTILTLLALTIGHHKGILPAARYQALINELDIIPEKIESVLNKIEPQIKYIAEEFKNATNFLYLGRGYNFPVALEGALKLKEISYIHAEGYPAAEMKHGPIALIDNNMPVVVLATNESAYEKIISNIQEVKARHGIIIAIASDNAHINDLADHVITIPTTLEPLSPMLAVVPLQLLAYHIAVLRGCNVDQPRNLAKSVTVE